MAAAGPGSDAAQPDGAAVGQRDVERAAPQLRAEAERQPDHAGQVGKHRVDVVGGDRNQRPAWPDPSIDAALRPASRGRWLGPTFTGPERLPARARRRQITPVRSIIVAFAARQAGIAGGFRRCGMRTWHQPRALEPEPQRFPMDRRDDLEGDQRQREERPQQRRRGQGAAAAVEGRGEQGAFAVGLQDAQFDASRRAAKPGNDSASPSR